MFDDGGHYFEEAVGEFRPVWRESPCLQDEPHTGAADFSERARALARFAFFGEELGDLPWALMLGVFDARLDGRQLTLAEAAEAVAMSPKAAPAWFSWLEKRNLLICRPGDRHGVETIDLTDWAADAVHAYLVAADPLLPCLPHRAQLIG